MSAVRERKLALAFDIGGTRIRAAMADLEGHLVSVARMQTETSKGPEQSIRRMIELGHQVLRESGAGRPAIIGVGCGGPLDADTGLILSPPNLHGWDAIPLKRILEGEFGAEAYVDNDANAAALGEHRFGAGIGVDDMVYITVSTGIGGGIIANGQLVQGVRASGGEVGHQTILPDGPRCNCGNRGCLEALASGTAIARRAREELLADAESAMLALAGGEIQNVTAETVVQAVRQGDALAIKLWKQTIEYLSVGVANVITTLAPEMVVLGGGVTEAGDLFYRPLTEAVRERVFMVPLERVSIVPAKLGQDAGILGAVAVALNNIDSETGQSKNRGRCADV